MTSHERQLLRRLYSTLAPERIPTWVRIARVVWNILGCAAGAFVIGVVILVSYFGGGETAGIIAGCIVTVLGGVAIGYIRQEGLDEGLKMFGGFLVVIGFGLFLLALILFGVFNMMVHPPTANHVVVLVIFLLAIYAARGRG